ncbi:hypothetical protein BG003_005918, partial [Podila horticola]
EYPGDPSFHVFLSAARAATGKCCAEERDWELVLGGVHNSILTRLILRGSNVPGAKKYKAVLGSQFQQLKGRVSGSLKKA